MKISKASNFSQYRLLLWLNKISKNPYYLNLCTVEKIIFIVYCSIIIQKSHIIAIDFKLIIVKSGIR
jgi:hypothetical protein